MENVPVRFPGGSVIRSFLGTGSTLRLMSLFPPDGVTVESERVTVAGGSVRGTLEAVAERVAAAGSALPARGAGAGDVEYAGLDTAVEGGSAAGVSSVGIETDGTTVDNVTAGAAEGAAGGAVDFSSGGSPGAGGVGFGTASVVGAALVRVKLGRRMSVGILRSADEPG
jgi:hypothetical protein